MFTRVLVLVAASAGAAVLAAPASAEDIVGHVFFDGGEVPLLFDPGDFPVRDTMLVIERLDPLPGLEFQTFTFSRPDGSYSFTGLEPGLPDRPATYQITAPLMAPAFVRMIRIPERPEDPPELLPRGVPVLPGPPTGVDLPVTVPPAPAGAFTVPGNVVGGTISAYTTMTLIDNQIPQRTSSGGEHVISFGFAPPLDFFDDGVILVQERTPAGGGSPVLAETKGSAFKFSDAPISPGDHVRIFLKEGQDLTKNWCHQWDPVVEFDWDGETEIPIVNFRLRPCYAIGGRVFLEDCDANRVFDDGDVAVGGQTVRLWTLTSPPPADPLEETTTAGDGTYAFSPHTPGNYLVRVGPIGAAAAKTLFRSFTADAPPPANFPFLADDAIALVVPDDRTVEADLTTPTVVPVTVVRPRMLGLHLAWTIDGGGGGSADVAPDTTPGSEDLGIPLTLAVGNHTIGVSISTDCATKTGSFHVKVVDTRAPVIRSVVAGPDVLLNPNHRMVTVEITEDSYDLGDAAPRCKIVSVTSNEPDNGLGDGDTPGDISILDDLHVALRAERSGKGSGRIYTITFECRDASGNATRKTCTVRVPRDQGKK
jgi:hypothetical protein